MPGENLAAELRQSLERAAVAEAVAAERERIARLAELQAARIDADIRQWGASLAALSLRDFAALLRQDEAQRPGPD